ncbi:putative Ig domain-containing protein [Hymenobacter properus]|uniref:Ig domain-containing protein n=1 Tax=Hymenobacter properus TaxID=2791026 RepID=A0A931BG97_9BACT|nr:putative Ig domain-containing protein [Hymenobacter properus]MBF9141101.1 putative Ig domain-containing protein [Hymenobacter properus]MBR7719910.1 putative Ig domain-containing protein [Microvirga sp. SRT04]
MKKHLILWLLLLLSGSAWAQLSIRESFEGTSSEYGYTSSFSNTTSNSVYFTRTTNPKTGFGNPVVQPTPDGSWFWASEGVRDFNRTIPSATLTLNGIPNAGNYNNIQISILVTDPRAATNSPVASSDEHLRIQYVYTPTNVVPAASSFITAGEFRGLNPGTVSSWYQFVNGTQGPALTGSFTNFDFSIPNGTGYLFVRVEADQNQPGAELGFDNIRVTGSQATTLRPTLTTTDTGDRAYAEGAAALPIFTNLTVDNPSGTTLDAAKVVFTNGTRVAAQDELTYTIPAGSGITFDAANSTNGALAFTGSSSEANYQNLLLSVRYRNITSTAARGGTRSFAFTVSDGANTSSPLNRNVVVTATLNSAVGLAVPFTVDFETDGEGTTYGSNTATSGTQGFVRLTGAPGATFNSTTVFSQIQGSGYFYGRGTKEFLPASSDGLPTAGNNIATPLGGVLMLAPINTTGYTNLHFKLKAAAAGNTFSSDDFLRFSYNLNSGAGWQAFPSGNFTGSGGALLQNGTGTALTTTMQDVDITLPAAVAGTNVSFRVEVGDNGGEEIAFDNIQVTGTPVPTTITSIVRASTNPTNATTVQYTVTFAASVTGLTTANFSVTTTGTLGATPSVSSVSGSGTTYTVTVNTGSGSGTLTLNLNNSTGLTPSVSNVPFAGETYTIDKTAPTTTITSSTPGVSNGSTTATTPIAFTVTFTENVSNFTSSDVQVTGGTLSGFFAASNSTYTFNVTPSGSGSTVRVNVAANVAQDLAGNGNTAASQYSVTYQQPLVASSQAVTVNLTANGTATLNASSVNNGSSGGGTLTYTIQKIVYGRVTEGSTLALSTPNGANFTSIPFAVYGSPTGTNGNYGPSTCGSPTGNGGTPGTDVRATVNASLINRNSGTIDANNNTFGDPCSGTPKALAVQAAYSANAPSLTYDCSEANKTQYVLLTVSSSDGQTSTSVAQVTVNPSPTITISNVSPTSALRGTPVTVTGTNLSGVTSVTVNGATATVGNLTANGFSFVVPTTATFGAGNISVAAPCSQTVTSAFTVQQPVTAAPVVTAPANGSLTNNSQPTYSGTAPAGSTVTVYVGPASGAASAIGTTTATASGNFSLAQPTALTSGSYQVYATAQTSGSTVSANSNTNTFTVDTTAPTVTSLTSSTVTNGGSTTTSPVLFTATFSEPVTGFASGDIAVSGGTVTSGPTAGSGNTFTFQVTPSGAGNVTVQVLANTVQDQAGNFNPASSTYSFTYSLPLVTATLTQVTPSPTATATLTYRATFSGGVTGLNTGNFSVANSGTSVSGASVASVTAVSGSTTTYDVVVNTGTGNGSLELQLVNSTGVSPTVSSLPVRGPGYTLYKSFLAKPTLRIQGMGSPSGFSDVTAFVDLVQVLQSGTTTVVTNGIQNGSFEANNVPAGGFLYQQTGVVASPWTFTTQAGVSRNGSGFGSTAADLNAVALLQSLSSTGNNGSVAQPLAVPTGSYQVRFRAAERTNNGRNDDQVLNVYLLDNFNNTVFVGSIQPDISGLGLYGTFTSATFTVTAAPLTATVSTSSTSPTSTAPIPFSVSFTQSVGTSFTASDVTVTGGTLTSGSFSGSGAGPYTFTVTPSGFGTVSVTLADNVAFDDNNTGNAFTNTASVQFAAPTITVSPATLVGGTRGTSYSQALSASGGTAPYIYAITAGALPTGLTLTAAGLLSGTPAASGSFTFTVTATDASAAPGPYSGSRNYTLTIAAPTIVVAPATLLTGTVATAYSQALSASGGTAPYAYAITAGALPAGLSLTNGTIAGTPTAGGSFTFVVTATDASTAGSGGPYSGSRSYTLTVAAPTITVAPASLPNGTQGTAYSQTLTASGGTAPYAFAITAGALPNGLTLTNGTLSGTPTASGTFNFTVTATDASAAPGPYSGSRAYSLTIAAPAVTAVTWTGNNNTNWFDASNWTPNQVPDATLDATIPTSPSGGRFPIITANAPANARNLSIASGASLTMTDNTLILAANLTNNGIFAGFSGSNGGTLVLGSSALSLLNGGGVNRFWNLTVGPNGAQLNNPNVTSVRRLLLLNGNFAANGNPFTLVSDAAGTAMVVNNSSAVVTGTATVQRYIDPSLNPNLGYRHVSPAIGNATVSSLTTSGYTPVVNPAYNTSATPLLVPSFPTVYGYDPTRLTTTNNNLNLFDKGWYSPNALTDPLNVGQGYTVLIGGGQTWNFTGPLNNGTQTVNVARPAALPTDGSAGYNLVGNPYPSPLDWSQVSVADRPNVGGTMYVYQSNDPRNPYTGVYGFYSASAGIGTVSPVVAQGQGFFVQVAQGQTNGSVTFRNSQRPTTYTSPTYQRTTETRPLVELHLQGAGSTLTDAAFVYFEQGATDGFDAQYDAEKLPNPSGLNLSTSLSATQRLAIDGRAPLTTTQRVVPLAVGVPAVGSYTLSTAQLLNLGTTPVYLRDLQSGAVIDLRTQPSYTFTVSNASALITGRFELVFSPQAVLATAPAALAAQVGLYPNPATTTAFVELPAALGRTAVVAELVDALGRSVRTQSLPAQGAAPHRLSLADLATGVYTLHLKTSAGVIVKKLVVE